MEKRTLTALKGSIAKWKAIVAGTGEDRGNDNCPLCLEFWLKKRSCAQCPVAIATGKWGCEDSPYEDWDEAWSDDIDAARIATTSDLIELAQAELDFLKSLLPEGEANS